MRRKMFSGYCDGGPYHGKVLHHAKPWFTVIINNNKPLTYRASEVMLADPNCKIQAGAYEHRNDRWLWKIDVS